LSSVRFRSVCSFPTRRSSDLSTPPPKGDVVARAPTVGRADLSNIRTGTENELPPPASAASPADEPPPGAARGCRLVRAEQRVRLDRKSTRLNSSHVKISHAVR